MSKKILIIDSITRDLEELTVELRDTSYDYTYRVCDYEQAEVNCSNYHLIIVFIDFKNIKTIQFLERLKSMCPQTMRLVFSHYVENEVANEIIEKNLAKMYVFKPWDIEHIISVIDRFFAFKRKINNDNMLEIINKTNVLPTLPQLYHDISKMAKQGLDMQLIAKHIECDIAIAARVLRVANSAFYGAKTGSVLQAVMYLGTENIKNIILSTTVFSGVSRTQNVEKLWMHSELTNRIINHLYYFLNGRNIVSINSSIGLLHDIGLLVSMTCFKEIFADAYVKYRSDKNISLISVEKTLLGYTHCEVGGYLMEWWDLPQPIVDAALYYITPDSERCLYLEATSLVHVASHLAWQIIEDDMFKFPLDYAALEYIGLSARELESFKEQHKMHYKK